MRSRTVARVLAGSLAVSLVVVAMAGSTSTPVAGAHAVETCFGLPATVDVPPGTTEVHGTEGDDVIVAEDVSRVEALGGDDAVCVESVAWVDAGEGNDRVSSHAGPGRSIVVLGSGSDLFEGSASRDRVYAEMFDGDDPFPGTGTENTDVVRTYGGRDVVQSGAYDQANDDRVELGGGDDTITELTSLGGEAEFLGAHGADRLLTRVLPFDGPALSYDLLAGTATADGVRFTTLEDFEHLSVSASVTTPVAVRGTADANELYVAGRADVAAGAGRDRVTLHGDPRSIRGGPGRDEVEVQGYSDFENTPVVYDLGRGTFTRAGTTVPFETEQLHVRTTGPAREPIRILGSGGRDDIVTGACGTVVRAAGGDDRLRSLSEFCDGNPTTLYGGPGSDVLWGGQEHDVLVGGAGRDRADGGPGTDVCRAEVERGCERG